MRRDRDRRHVPRVSVPQTPSLRVIRGLSTNLAADMGAGDTSGDLP